MRCHEARRFGLHLLDLERIAQRESQILNAALNFWARREPPLNLFSSCYNYCYLMATRELFTAFRTELDAFHDRRERLVKISRDITTLSKRVIFLLHRLAQEGRSFDEKGVVGEDKEVNEKLNDINNHWTRISSELDGESYWKFSPCMFVVCLLHYAPTRSHSIIHSIISSPGLQEYIEAISFLHYLGTGKLMSYKAVQSSLISRSSGRQVRHLCLSLLVVPAEALFSSSRSRTRITFWGYRICLAS
jgi:hypothetical protein